MTDPKTAGWLPDRDDVAEATASMLRLERDGWRDNANKLGSEVVTLRVERDELRRHADEVTDDRDRLRVAARTAAVDLNTAMNDPDGHDLVLVATKVADRLDHAADS